MGRPKFANEDFLDAALAGGQKVLPGDVAFKLHDTYGFPLDLSADVCRERGVTVDEAGFNGAIASAQITRSRPRRFSLLCLLHLRNSAHYARRPFGVCPPRRSPNSSLISRAST